MLSCRIAIVGLDADQVRQLGCHFYYRTLFSGEDDKCDRKTVVPGGEGGRGAGAGLVGSKRERSKRERVREL